MSEVLRYNPDENGVLVEGAHGTLVSVADYNVLNAKYEMAIVECATASAEHSNLQGEMAFLNGAAMAAKSPMLSAGVDPQHSLDCLILAIEESYEKTNAVSGRQDSLSAETESAMSEMISKASTALANSGPAESPGLFEAVKAVRYLLKHGSCLHYSVEKEGKGRYGWGETPNNLDCGYCRARAVAGEHPALTFQDDGRIFGKKYTTRPPMVTADGGRDLFTELKEGLEEIRDRDDPSQDPQCVPINGGEWYECSECGDELGQNAQEGGIAMECGKCGHQWWEFEYIPPPADSSLKRADDLELYRHALTEITCCSSIQDAAIIANGALLEFQPITDEDMEWAKNAADSRRECFNCEQAGYTSVATTKTADDVWLCARCYDDCLDAMPDDQRRKRLDCDMSGCPHKKNCPVHWGKDCDCGTPAEKGLNKNE